MRSIVILACATLLVNTGYGQTDKDHKRSKAGLARKERQSGSRSRVATRWVMIDRDGKELTPEQSAMLAMQPISIPQPEPLIGIHYLLDYPKEAQDAKAQGTVTFTVRVRAGKVIDAKIDRPDNMYLTTAVLEAANRLQFDPSWHTPGKLEFEYTRSVEFLLPDVIRPVAPPTIAKPTSGTTTPDAIYITP